MGEFDKFVKWIRKNMLPPLVTAVVTNVLGIYAFIVLLVLLFIFG